MRTKFAWLGAGIVSVLGIVALILLIYFVPHMDDVPHFVRVATYGTPNPFHAGNIGLPQYVILDPGAIDKPLATKFDGSYGKVPAFKKFFARALRKAKAKAGG